jgi:hypothetical protein
MRLKKMILKTGNIYEQDLQPLNDIVSIVFELYVKPEIDQQINKYKDKVLVNESSIYEFKECIKINAVAVRDAMSDKYYKLLLGYFSDKGVALLIMTWLTSKSKSHITG